MTLYGIKNCDTVRKARKWLDARQLDIPFHDFREDGLSQELVSQWAHVLGWENLFNRRSTSFRELSDAEKSDLTEAKAIALMLSYPTLIKRPVLCQSERVMVGFKEAQYQAWFGS